MSFSFGSSTGNQGSSGGGFSFGSSNTAPSSSGFNFGSSSNTTQGGTGSGFNFGGTSNAASSGGTGSGFNFGGSSNNAPFSGSGGSGFSFGGNTSSAAPPSGGFNFGNTSSSSTTPATSSGFNFGSSTASTAPSSGGGFNFGGTSSSGTTGSGGGGFNFGGSSTNAPSSSGFNFGSSTGTGSSGGFNFGSGGTSGGLSFGTGSKPAFDLGTSSSTFGKSWGSSTLSASGGSGGIVFNAGPTGQNIQMQTALSELSKITQFYSPDSRFCRFMFWFYNTCDPAKKQMYEQKIIEQYRNVISPRQFQEGRNGNPDSRRFYAVPARSFEDLTKRVNKQNERTAQFKTLLQSLEKRIEALRRHHEIHTIANVEQIKLNYMKLYSRLLRNMSLLEVLYQRGVGVGSIDITLQTKFHLLQSELQKPNQFRGRLNELIPKLNYHLQNSPSLHAPAINEQALEQVTIKEIENFFAEQTHGLKLLTKILDKDEEDVKYMETSLRSVQQKDVKRRPLQMSE